MSEQRGSQRKFAYAYSLSVDSILAGNTETPTVNIDASSNFIATKVTYFVTDNAATQQTDSSRIVPNLLIQIKDTASSRDMFIEPQPISSIAGTAERPYILPTPQLFTRNGTIQGEFTNFGGVELQNVFLTFHGYKIFAN